MSENLIREINGRPVWWTDKAVTHACEGADVHPGIRLFWPRCGKGDVPANEGFHPGDGMTVTCPSCLDVLRDEARGG